MKSMDFLYNNRKLIMRLSFVLWLVVQVFLVIKYWNLPQYSDAKLYMDSAMECYMGGQWYPNIHQLNSQQYLFNPGFINFLILELKVFGTFMYHGIIGIVINLILLVSVRKIIKELVNDEASDYATIYIASCIVI